MLTKILLQIAESHHEDVTIFTMHDLVHDVARLVMIDEVLLTSEQANTDGISYHYALLSNCIEPLETSTDYPNKIRALRFMNCKKHRLDDGAFSSAKFLRVLDLSECSIQKLPDSIGQLKQLRYLNAPGVQDQMIPNCITKLIKLMYLSLRGSSKLLSLPESVGEMEELMYLDLSDCSGIRELPESFGKLKKLLHLDFSDCSCIRSLSLCLGSLTELQYLNLSCSSDLYLPEVQFLGNLTKLEYLNLSCSSNLFIPGVQFLGALTKLNYLNLSSQHSNLQSLPEDFGSLIELKYLSLSGCDMIVELPRSFEKLKNLVHLDLSCCSSLLSIPQALHGLAKLEYLNLSLQNGEIHQDKLPLMGLPEVIGSLRNLRYLNLARCMDYVFDNPSTDQTDSFIGSISTFSNLEHLDLSENSVLRSLPESIGSLRMLHTLNLSGSSKLARLPECLIKMESLKVLNVKGCKLFEAKLPQSNFLFTLPHFVVHAGEGQSRSNLPLLEHAILDKQLELSRLENVKSTQEARSIKLIEKESINDLKLEWTRGADRYVEDMNVLEEMVPPSTLTEFKIEGYSSISFPSWVMNTGNHLPNLVRIILWDLPKCNSLPPFGQLPNLGNITLGRMHGLRRIDRGIYGGPGAFPRLTRFRLLAMHNLEELDFRDDLQTQLVFPVLHNMEISDCPKVRMKSSPPRAVNWTIILSDNVLSSRVERCHTSASSFSAVACLSVHLCKLVPMHQWLLLCHLPPLVDLHIEGCGDLSSASPEIIRALSSLESLTLEDNDQGEGLPRWLGELQCLQDLSLVGFQELKDLEGNMRRLTSLQSLDLYGCNTMASLPQWLGELTSLEKLTLRYRKNLNDLQQTMCDNLTSLQPLTLEKCVRIPSQPERMSKLNSLKELKDSQAEQPRLLGGITCVQNLTLNGFPDLLDLQGSMRQLTSLPSLYLYQCNSMTSLPQWLGELTSLKRLRIEGCEKLNDLQETLCNITSLQSLELEFCHKIHSLPERMGDLISLKELQIDRCKGISSLPESIQQLTNLENLCIHMCPGLRQWYQSDENEKKLAHIKKRVCAQPSYAIFYGEIFYGEKLTFFSSTLHCHSLLFPVETCHVRDLILHLLFFSSHIYIYIYILSLFSTDFTLLCIDRTNYCINIHSNA